VADTTGEPVTLTLYINGSSVDVITDSGGFEFTIPVTDLIAGINSFYVIATNTMGGQDTSNVLTFDATPDPYPPSVPEGVELSGDSPTELLIEWYPSSDEEAYGATGDDDYLGVL
jgi:hypothetical protein